MSDKVRVYFYNGEPFCAECNRLMDVPVAKESLPLFTLESPTAFCTNTACIQVGKHGKLPIVELEPYNPPKGGKENGQEKEEGQEGAAG